MSLVKLITAVSLLVVMGLGGVGCNQTADGSQKTDSTPPAISNVYIANITETSATIDWTTDQASTGQVEYGGSPDYELMSLSVSEPETSHCVVLVGLHPNTTYHFRVQANDSLGNQSVSGDYTFTTVGPDPVTPDTSPPLIPGVHLLQITTSSVTIYWTTDEESTSQVEYGRTSNYGTITPSDGNLNTQHRVSIGGLQPGSTYHYRVFSADLAGNGALSESATFTTPLPDTTPPVISGVHASDVSSSSVTINWSTDEPATSQVRLTVIGKSTYNIASDLNISPVTTHKLVLTDLFSKSIHYYRVISCDMSGNQAISEEYSFTLDLTWIGAHYAAYGELPLVPDWLAPLIPLNAGDRLTPDIDILSASMQYWGTLMPSQQQKLLETVCWVGDNPEDYLWRMYQMAPPSPDRQLVYG